MEESDQKWRGVIAGVGKRSQVEGNFRRCRGRWQVDRSDLRWRGAISHEGKHSKVEGSFCRWRGAI